MLDCFVFHYINISKVRLNIIGKLDSINDVIGVEVCLFFIIFTEFFTFLIYL